MAEYFIFSDESGMWNTGSYYVRCWIKIRSNEYLQLEKEVIYSKYKTGVKELKYDKFCGNQDEFKNIFSADCSIFITISDPNHCQNIPYTILSTLQNIDVFQSTGGQHLTETIKEKLITSARHTLFFNYFESQHIKTSKDALIGTDDTRNYKYLVDAPQCLSKDWEEIARECGVQELEVVRRSEEHPGIELADVVAGCIFNKIQGDGLAASIYDLHIKNKMTDMTSRDHPNPNLIFHRNFTTAQRTQLNIFR